MVDLPSLYLITDSKQTGGKPLTEVLNETFEGGVRMVQLREKDLSGRELYELACKVKKLADEYGAKLLINDRVDIAMMTEADGVHLPADSFTAVEARELLSDDKIVGVSTHSIEEVVKAEKEGADFVTFSPIYHTPSKAAYGNPQGLKSLRKACESVNIPVYALGGVKAENIKEVKEAGAFGVAVISAIIAARDIRQAAEKISETIKLTKY